MNKKNERVKYLLQNWSHLQLAWEYEKLENIIKEVREYIKEHSTTINFKTMRADYNLNMNELLEILDKVD